MKLGWGIGLGLLAVVAVGCDVSVCTKDVDGKCFDFPDLDFDASSRLDASSDGGARTDGAISPADAAVVDGAVVADSGARGIDGGAVDSGAGPALLSIEDFCDAEYKTAKGWRDRLEQCCPRGQAITDASELLLAQSLFYGRDGTGKDSVEKCIDGLKGSAANLTFVPSAAPACAAAFNAQFVAAPAACPAEGFAAETLESSIGHAAASLNQLPECRAAIVGKIARDAACSNAFECQSGLRCLAIVGSGGADGGVAKTCRPPLDRGNPCTATSECADGFVCMGLASGSGGRVCYAKGEPLEVNSSCSASTECRSGLLCVNNKCVAPRPDLICKQ